jgi:hypothetical protein
MDSVDHDQVFHLARRLRSTRLVFGRDVAVLAGAPR